MAIWEYRTVSYGVENYYYQKIRYIYADGKELTEWKGQPWSAFLAQMGKEGWEITSAGISDASGMDSGIIFFKRPIEGPSI